MKRLKGLERENSRLKRLYADLSLEKLALVDVIAKKPEGQWASRAVVLNRATYYRPLVEGRGGMR